jgi:hypothetical protein
MQTQRYRIYIGAVSAPPGRDTITSVERHACRNPRRLIMSSRKLGELSADLDEASTTVEELQNDPDDDADEKLDELHKTLEDASDTVDELEDQDE